MPSQIEAALYGEWADQVSDDGHVGAHCLVEFSVARDPIANGIADIIRIGVVPELSEYTKSTVATFANAHLGRFVQTDYDYSESNYLPWFIVGFHSQDCGAGKWSFQLNCHSVRIDWFSDWPCIERGE